ncbi:MAG: hypothetical protein A2X67_01795 [Ignavibacteria bacterium GWA2_55_11]|nr:MAG: hypothetical protein A2X67_01795 [Ignavibacteria bacterium GWA2_55_11]OGU71330.1 MAG: hypothetical protein A3G43_13670 [Ignavibacteria bacterium RIFCSPLOWO2_12_FULL_56_21]OGU75569.1 MAG: hypothetical protein A3H45_11330 [Ignavibacteria bacterium RIFCSPLOWO2_02_FULL_55_14]
MPRQSLECVIFDMDGTITRTNRLIFDAFNHIVEIYKGERWTDAQISALFGPPEEGALATVVGQDRVDEAMRSYLAFYREHHAELASVYKGMPEILHELKSSGVKLALFTGKGRHTTAITLEVCGLGKYFDKVVTGNDVMLHKPSGEGIRSIMHDLGVTQEGTFMVGDAVADILAAREAGIRIASVLWDSYGRERVLREQRDLTFESVEEFGAWAIAAARKKGS